jgi:hypothetical protein
VLADGFVQCRDLIPCRIDSEASAMVADAVRISSIHAGEGHHVATG